MEAGSVTNREAPERAGDRLVAPEFVQPQVLLQSRIAIFLHVSIATRGLSPIVSTQDLCDLVSFTLANAGDDFSDSSNFDEMQKRFLLAIGTACLNRITEHTASGDSLLSLKNFIIAFRFFQTGEPANIKNLRRIFKSIPPVNYSTARSFVYEKTFGNNDDGNSYELAQAAVEARTRKDWPAVIAHERRILEKDPERVQAMMILAEALEKTGEFAEALAIRTQRNSLPYDNRHQRKSNGRAIARLQRIQGGNATEPAEGTVGQEAEPAEELEALEKDSPEPENKEPSILQTLNRLLEEAPSWKFSKKHTGKRIVPGEWRSIITSLSLSFSSAHEIDGISPACKRRVSIFIAGAYGQREIDTEDLS